ncbi:uncharacterized protein [Haliotis cracherodii]|uniref:uncharacterized protein n=1 Tax=Haliotis cracherodii TaxID=6455 RepID=UPI0039EBD882
MMTPTLNILLSVAAIYFVQRITATPCPQVAIWESTYSIVGYQKNLSAFVWVRPTDNQFVVTCNPSCSGTSTYSATFNDTQSTLTVGRISTVDAGFWRIKDANVDNYTPICNLTTANLPTCDISSDLDPLSLELGAVLSITVNIKNYSCSDQAGFDLTTGDVTETLLRNDNATLNTNEVLNSIVNVTLTRLGDVRLNFTCLDTSWELDCGGVKQLLKSPPSCNISSDVETDDLELGTEVTLSVDIRNYYCSKQAEFNLTTGSTKEVLLARHDVDDISSAFPNTTFNATDERFGKVLVKFSCDNYIEDLICGGIEELVKRLPSTTAATTSPSATPPDTPSLTSTTTTAGSPAQDPDVPVALIAGVCAGVLVLVVIVVVVLLNRRKITAVARKYIVTRKTQHSQFEDGLESSTSEPTLDMKDNVAFDEIKLDNVEKVADSEHE